MYCCAWCQHFRNTEKEGSDGYCFIDGTDVRLEDVCDEFEKQEVKEGKRGNKMTNEEWLKSLSAEELARVIHQGKDCKFCKYEKTRCIDCEEGITEWLKQEHIEPMPELKVGYIISSYYPTTKNTVNYVYLGNSVLWCDKDESFVKFENNMKKFIKAIYRKDVDDFTKVELWRADNEKLQKTADNQDF